MTPLLLLRIIAAPNSAFVALTQSRPRVAQVFFGYVLWIGLIPPVCAFIGMRSYGWRFGVGDAVYLSDTTALLIAAAYYLCLFFGYLATVALMRWMAPTYNASSDHGQHAALTAIVGTPLMLGGVLHLYPLLPLNLLALIPALIWSVYLLYTGVPKMLGTDEARGLLLASSILGVYFILVIGLAGLIMILWVNGLGPDIGFDWRLSVEG